jgi:DNA-binding NarL/FixJ family response regulator
MSTRAIATDLDLSVKTVETCRARIEEKLGFANSLELTRAAVTWSQI